MIFQSTGTGVGQVAAPVITSSQSLLLEKTEVGDEYYWDVEIEYTPTSFLDHMSPVNGLSCPMPCVT